MKGNLNYKYGAIGVIGNLEMMQTSASYGKHTLGTRSESGTQGTENKSGFYEAFTHKVPRTTIIVRTLLEPSLLN